MPTTAKKRSHAEAVEDPYDPFETELRQILNESDEEYGSTSDRLHLATDLWESNFSDALPDFFSRMRPWVKAKLADDTKEHIIFERVGAMSEEEVKTELTSLPQEEGGSVDEDEAAEALALTSAAARKIRLLRFLLEDADEYELVEGEEGDEEDESDGEDGDDFDDDIRSEGEDGSGGEDSGEEDDEGDHSDTIHSEGE